MYNCLRCAHTNVTEVSSKWSELIQQLASECKNMEDEGTEINLVQCRCTCMGYPVALLYLWFFLTLYKLCILLHAIALFHRWVVN